VSDARKGQVSGTAAEIYEEFFVPALFGQWAGPVADAAAIRSGQRVLDVACGTGVLAREISDRVGSGGSVAGLDVNDGMLEIAQRKAPGIEWLKGPAERLPFEDQSFDAVVSQFALMFFNEPTHAIEEMHRVVRPGGRLAVAVWDAIDRSPGYAALSDLLHRLFGEEATESLRAPFSLGDKTSLAELFAYAGLSGVEIATHPGNAKFPSIRSWMFTEVRGWTLADKLDDPEFESLVLEAEKRLGAFVGTAGAVEFAAPAHIVTATKG
jgi:SAM-dependent methyltransferase